jgi:hypothetical protein
MGMFPFYNVRKPRQFTHKPIYWDPRKEALDERIRKIKSELGEPVDTPDTKYTPAIKGSFVEGTAHLKKHRSHGLDSRERTYRNTRLVLILVLLAVLFWFLYIR